MRGLPQFIDTSDNLMELGAWLDTSYAVPRIVMRSDVCPYALNWYPDGLNT